MLRRRALPQSGLVPNADVLEKLNEKATSATSLCAHFTLASQLNQASYI